MEKILCEIVAADDETIHGAFKSHAKDIAWFCSVPRAGEFIEFAYSDKQGPDALTKVFVMNVTHRLIAEKYYQPSLLVTQNEQAAKSPEERRRWAATQLGTLVR